MNARRQPPPATLEVQATLSLRFDQAQECQQAKEALAPESEGFLSLEAKANRLQVTVPAGAVGRVLATVDDTLACLQTAWETKAASDPPGSHGTRMKD